MTAPRIGRVVFTREPAVQAAGDDGTRVTVEAVDRAWHQVPTPFVGVPFSLWRDRLVLFLEALPSDAVVVYRRRRDDAHPLREVAREEWLSP